MAVQTFVDTYLIQRDDAHNETQVDAATSDTVVAKAVAMSVLFLASLIMGTLPLQLSKWFKWDRQLKKNSVVCLLLSFGGGVLLCTTFLHLLPEVSETLDELTAAGVLPEVRFHPAELLMCVGFFAMYFVEECVHAYLRKREKSFDLKVLRRSLSIRRGESQDQDQIPNGISTSNLVKSVEDGLNGHNHDSNHNHNHVDHSHKDHNHGGHSHAGHSHVIFEDSVVKSIRGLLIVLALSIHELFEGLAVGLESSAATVWYMFGAVSAHKLVIAFCIGVELITTQTKTLLTVIYVFTFAVVSPLGIGIGIAVSGDAGDSTTLPSVILQGLASGTLLYVVFFEILQKDRSGGLRQYLAVFLGFLVMFGITILTAHEHSHDHGHEEAATAMTTHFH